MHSPASDADGELVNEPDRIAGANAVKHLANKIRIFFQFQRGILLEYGWLRAWWSERPVNAIGEPIPWISYPAIDFLSQFDFSESSVFEWGSGFSTIWWAKRCRRVTTVESNPAWLPYIKTLLPPTVELLVTPLDENAEIAALTDHKVARHDVFIIDNFGPHRRRCAEVAAAHLNEGGLIILDNSDQCLQACAALRRQGFTQIDFTGFAPGAGYAQGTSCFFKNNLKFATVHNEQPQRGPAQPNPPWENC
jgi:hypothetical protein